jgi:hypothetical protein
MTPPGHQRICAVRVPGTLRARFCDPANVNLSLGDWVAIPSVAGEDAGRLVVTPDQVILSGLGDPLPAVIRVLNDDEMLAVAGQLERARSLIDVAADVLRSAAERRFLCGLRFNLAGDAMVAAYVGEPLDDRSRPEAALSDAVGMPVFLECESAERPEDAQLFGGPGQPRATSPDLETIVRQRFNVPGDEPIFAPEGIPRLNSRVKTGRGAGRMIAMDVRRRLATVRLDDGETVQVPPEELSPLTEETG